MSEISSQDCDCTNECPPLTEAGPRGAAGVGTDGTDGTDGVNAYTTLTASFVLPAVNSSITAHVGSSVWMAYGQTLLIGTGSTYSVLMVTAKPSSTTVTIKNLGGTGGASPGTTIPNSSNVVVAGREGAAGTGNIDLATHVTGVLPIVNGGTGASSAADAFNALMPLTTNGDLIGFQDGSAVRIAKGGAEGQILRVNTGSGTGLEWGAVDVGNTDAVTGVLPVDNGGTGLSSLTTGTILIANGSNTFGTIKYNLAATSDPTIANDNGAGYAIGSRWINVTTDEEFVCLDNSAGAAVWYSTTNGAAAGFSRTPVSAGSYTVQNDDTFVCFSADTVAITLPNPASYPNAFLTLKHEGSAPTSLSILPSSGTTVEGSSSISINITRGYVTLYKTSSTTWRVLNRNTYKLIALADGGTGSSLLVGSNSKFVRVNVGGDALEAHNPMTVVANSGADSITPTTPAADTFDGAGQSYHTFASLDQTKWAALLSQIEALRDTVEAQELFIESFITVSRTNKLLA